MAVCVGGLEVVPGELANHLVDCQAVGLPDVVQETQGVVLVVVVVECGGNDRFISINLII